MENYKFDIFFNHNAEDTYLVQNISQHFRDLGFKTFDRSVNRIPVTEIETLSEDDALASSRVMIYVLTENSINDPSDEDLASRARKNGKKIVVMHFDDTAVPELLSLNLIVKADRTNLKPALNEVETALKS